LAHSFRDFSPYNREGMAEWIVHIMELTGSSERMPMLSGFLLFLPIPLGWGEGTLRYGAAQFQDRSPSLS
jgi:hypothetical protein